MGGTQSVDKSVDRADTPELQACARITHAKKAAGFRRVYLLYGVPPLCVHVFCVLGRRRRHHRLLRCLRCHPRQQTTQVRTQLVGYSKKYPCIPTESQISRKKLHPTCDACRPLFLLYRCALQALSVILGASIVRALAAPNTAALYGSLLVSKCLQFSAPSPLPIDMPL